MTKEKLERIRELRKELSEMSTGDNHDSKEFVLAINELQVLEKEFELETLIAAKPIYEEFLKNGYASLPQFGPEGEILERIHFDESNFPKMNDGTNKQFYKRVMHGALSAAAQTIINRATGIPLVLEVFKEPSRIHRIQ